MNLVIVADGTFPTHPLPLAALRDADLIIACDGAAKTLLHAGFMPHCVVGDLDTLEQEIQQQLKDRLEHETEQETNDLSKAFRSALRKMSAADTLTILGATGKREDHTLGNLSLLADFAGQHRKIRLLTDHGTFLPVTGFTGIPCHPGQAVSFFNPTGNPVRLTGKNLKYPVNDLALDRWWTATLNTATADTVELATSPADATVIVFLNH